MKIIRSLAVMLSLLSVFMALPASASSLAVTKQSWAYRETLTSSDLTANFADITNWANGNIGSDNITDLSIAGIDIASNAVDTTKVLAETLLGGSAGDIHADTITDYNIAIAGISRITDAAVTTAKIAIDAAEKTYKVEEGTWASGICTGPVPMILVDVPTPVKPTANANLRVTTTAASTNETLIATLWFRFTCTGSCNSTDIIQYTCNYGGTEDTSYGQIGWGRLTTTANVEGTQTYINRYAAVTGGAKDLDCYIWEAAGSQGAYNYCARLIVEHVKR